MAISSKNYRVEQKNHSFIAIWHDLLVSSDHLLRLLDILSVDMYTSVSLAQSKIRLQKAFSPNAGALSLWHSPPQWAYGRMRVPRDLDCTLLSSRSRLLGSRTVSRQPKSPIWMLRETLRDDSQPWIGDTKQYILIHEKEWCHTILTPSCKTVLFLLNLFDLSSTVFEIFLFLCCSVQRFTLVALDLSFGVEAFLHRMAISFSDS